MLGLLVAGVVIGVAGLLSVGFAYPMKDFSFGNTLIVSGVTAACTGALLIAASLLLRELKSISAALGGASPRAGTGESEVMIRPVGAPLPVSPLVPPPEEPTAPAWQADTVAVAPETASAPADAGPPQRRRRNLLFTSTRRDRPPGEQGTAGEDQPPILGTDLEPPAPATFEDAWPAADRNRPEPPRPTPAPPPLSRATEPTPPRSPIPTRRSEPPPVTVLKSGVVDGMAYSLYSDGSIEAQLPEGMVRFASIDELRHHLDQRG